MKPCRQIESALAEYVARGLPSESPRYRPEREHLRHCSECRAFLLALQEVEDALHRPPEYVPDPSLTDRILAKINAEIPIEVETWRILPTAVWLPAMALVVALLMAFALIPGNAGPGLLVDAEPSRVAEGLSVATGGLWLALERDLFWPVWSGIAVTLAGFGLSLFLSQWDDKNKQEVVRFEEQARSAVSRVAEMARRARS